MAFEIKPKERHTLEVEIAGHGTSRVPLADSLPMQWLVRLHEIQTAEQPDEFEKIRFFYDLFRTHCGNAVDLLTIDELGQLIEAWDAACEAETGATPGE